MCGIIGYTGVHQAAPVLLDGLKHLEYRGYDSAGIAVHGQNGIEVVKAKGKLENLLELTGDGHRMYGHCGIGHTRWATHGEPDAVNAHPHASPENRVVMVHNGIIENHREIREALIKAGCVFQSQTDTEAAALLLDRLYAETDRHRSKRERAIDAILQMMKRLRGSYALGILFGDQPEALYAVRVNSPLAVGIADGQKQGYMLASDVYAMLSETNRVICLKDGEIACMTQKGIGLFDAVGREIKAQIEELSMDATAAHKGGYAHFMLKEMYEQPEAVRRTVAPRIRGEGNQKRIDLSDAGMGRDTMHDIDRLYLIGCGSAYCAACAGKLVIESLARVACETELASEWRYRNPVCSKRAWAVIISQSGETADSLSALRLCKEKGVRTLAIVNVPGSAIAREADRVLYTHAGPEISVATTKAYSAQLAALYLLAIGLAAAKARINGRREAELADALLALPEKIGIALSICEAEKEMPRWIAERRDVYFVGRGIDYAVCMEGSLKLKEISYIHAEAYAAGELKHGTISLIEKGVPVIGVATQRELRDKTLSNLEEARSRGACIVLVTYEDEYKDLMRGDCSLRIPSTEPLFAASLAVIPLQMLAYAVSLAKGLDVDKPRNLAKAVTVE